MITTPDDILLGADRCVKCGLCTPHCPTYALERDEAESPRGRIALMQGLAAGMLAPGERLITHLDNCLGCRACERVCPAGVPYGELLDATRDHLEAARSRSWPGRLLRAALFGAVARPRRLRALSRALRLYQRCGLQRLARGSGLLKRLRLARLEARLPPLPGRAKWSARYPAPAKERGRVALFTGCISEVADQPTLHAAVRVLNALGYAVDVPQGQTCCGALHQHNGASAEALALARANLRAFAEADAVVYVASGCGAQLAEYPLLGWASSVEREVAATLAGRVHEISDFLHHCDWSEVSLAPLPAPVAVHVPCTQRNVLRQPDSAERLLRRIPELDIRPLPGNERCCGAAGSHVLSHPEMADALRRPKLDALLAARPRYLATTNIGCALHLADGLRGAGAPVEVVHPVVLIERQLTGRESRVAGRGSAGRGSKARPE